MTKQFFASLFLFSFSSGYGNAEDNPTDNTESSNVSEAPETSKFESLHQPIQRTGTPVQLITPSEIQANVNTNGDVYSKNGASQKTLSPYFYVPSESATAESFPLKRPK